MRPFLLLTLLLLVSIPALAAEEVKGIRIETRGAAGADAREVAVAKATQQAAETIWKNAGHTDALPAFTPAQLQNLATYVDVTGETVQPNYYAATFNVGINRMALQGLVKGSIAPLPSSTNPGAATSTRSGAPFGETTVSMQELAAHRPAWVLVVPVHDIDGRLSVWNSQDGWNSAWLQAPSSPLFMAMAGGDDRDREIAGPEILQGDTEPSPGEALQQLMEKYKAPAVALVTLRSPKATLSAGDEATVRVSYLPRDSYAFIDDETPLFVTADNLATVGVDAVRMAQKLVIQLAGQAGGNQAVAAVPGSQSAMTSSPNFATVFSAPMNTAGWQKLWVKMPIRSLSDLAGYRRQVEAIPNTRLEIVTLTKTYVEANIVYSGEQAALLQALAARGLKPR